MSDDLKNKAIRGLLWSFFERIGQQSVSIVVSVVLARLLLPEEFGLIAILMIFIGIAKSFADSGFASALINKKEATFLDECSVLYFNVVLGAAMAGSLCFVSTVLACHGTTPSTASFMLIELNSVPFCFNPFKCFYRVEAVSTCEAL